MAETKRPKIYVKNKHEYDVMTIIFKVWNKFVDMYGCNQVRHLDTTKVEYLHQAYTSAFKDINTTRFELHYLFTKAKLPIGTLYDTTAPRHRTKSQDAIRKLKRQTIYLINTWFTNTKKYEKQLDDVQQILCVNSAPIFMFNTCATSYDACYTFVEQLAYMTNSDLDKLEEFIKSCIQHMTEKQMEEMNDITDA